jgi:esterase/lipase
MSPYQPEARPAAGYAEAAQRAAAMQALDGENVNPLSRTALMTHGERTPRAAVLLHGYTSSPAQWTQFGERLYQRGYNVFIPRFPGHGLRDVMTNALGQLTREILLAHLTEAVDIGRGLGEAVSVVGLSMSGILTSWVAQNRADVAQAMLVAAAFSIKAVPRRLLDVTTRAVLLAPNTFRWWDETIKDKPNPPYHAYPRLATHGLAHVLRIGLEVQAAARRSPPKAGRVIVVTNPSDESVDNSGAHDLTASWRASGGKNVTAYEFEARHALPHDLIDPENLLQNTALVYPVLEGLLEG